MFGLSRRYKRYWYLKKSLDIQTSGILKLSEPIVEDIVMPGLIAFARKARDFDLVDILLDVLQKCSTRYISAFDVHFETIIEVLFHLVQLESTDDTTRHIVWEQIASPNIGVFWSNHIPFANQMLLGFNAEIEEQYKVRCEPTQSFKAPEKLEISSNSILLVKNFSAVLEVLLHNCWGFVVANMTLHEQILHAIHWNVELGAILGMMLKSSAWFRSVYSLLNLVLRSSTTVVVKNRIDELLIKHFEYSKELFDQTSDLKAIHEWLEILLILLPANNAIIPSVISDLFLSPSTSFLMFDYRIQVAMKPNYMERLKAVSCGFLALNVPMKEWTNEIFELVQLMSIKAARIPNRIDPIRFGNLKISTLEQLIEFDILCVGAAGSSHDTQRNSTSFRILMNLHQRMAEEIETNSLFAWENIESHCLISLLDIANTNGFFLPRLNVLPHVFVENIDLIEYQFTLLKRLATPNHFGRNSMGMVWLKSWINFIKDKNYLDTPVGDSLVLLKTEQLLLRYLKKSSLQSDHIIRLEIGELWKLYLNSFAACRRSESNTPMIIRFFLQRMKDINPEVQKSFYTCLCLLDSLDSIISTEHLSKALKRDYVQEFKHLVMSSPCSGAFSSNHFQQVVKYIGMGSFLIPEDENYEDYPDLTSRDNAWLQNLYFSCQSEHVYDMMKADATIVLAGQSSFDCLLFWALWETARFFISSRLKTPFGTPMQSFEAIEKTLERYLKIFEAAKNEQGVDNDGMFQIMERMSYLLNLIDLLELQTTVASKGSTTTCPAPPLPCVIFFYSNQKVCQDWFSRIRSKVTNAATLLEEDGLILRHSFRVYFY
jgi:hypothetical protein